eukprot:762947-Hanusia_phi.AAC.9
MRLPALLMERTVAAPGPVSGGEMAPGDEGLPTESGGGEQRGRRAESAGGDEMRGRGGPGRERR